MEPSDPWWVLLKRERDNCMWTQNELAERLGSDARTIRGWESGANIPSKAFLRRICELYRKSPEDLGLDADALRKAKASINPIQSGDEVAPAKIGVDAEERTNRLSVVVSETERYSNTMLVRPLAEEDQPSERLAFSFSAAAPASSKTPFQRFASPFPAVWNVSRRPSTCFTGRDSHIKRLYDAFAVSSEAGISQPHRDYV